MDYNMVIGKSDLGSNLDIKLARRNFDLVEYRLVGKLLYRVVPIGEATH